MLQIAICDDQINELESIYLFVEEYRKNHPDLDLSVRRFQSSYDLIDAVSSRGHYDIYILDILMPNINGIQAGEIIRQKDMSAEIIYLTSSPDFALDSYKVKAQSYLIKPAEKEKFFRILDETIEQLEAENTKRLLLRTANGIEAAAFGRIVYAEYYKHHLYCHMLDKSVLESLTLREPFDQVIEALLADGRFLKISLSHVINMQHVQSLRRKNLCFCMADGTELLVTRAFSSAKQTYIEYILERGLSNEHF